MQKEELMLNTAELEADPEGSLPELLVRLSVLMNAETTDQLRNLKEEKGLSATETVRRAIAVYAFLNDEQNAGKSIHIVNPRKGRYAEMDLL
jgi:hypothetical protein